MDYVNLWPQREKQAVGHLIKFIKRGGPFFTHLSLSTCNEDSQSIEETFGTMCLVSCEYVGQMLKTGLIQTWVDMVGGRDMESVVRGCQEEETSAEKIVLRPYLWEHFVELFKWGSSYFMSKNQSSEKWKRFIGYTFFVVTATNTNISEILYSVYL